MKLIFLNKITAVSATEENANFPADYVSNNQIRKQWRATSEDAVLTSTVSGGSDVFTLFGTNAGNITITIKDLAETSILDGPFSINLGAESRSSHWQEYEYQGSSHKVILDIADTQDNEDAYVGVVRGGFGTLFMNPRTGLREQDKNYSLVKTLSSGSTWIGDKPIVRTFTGEVRADRDSCFRTYYREIKDTVGFNPRAMLILDEELQAYSIFGRLSIMTTGKHAYYTDSLFNINILEMV